MSYFTIKMNAVKQLIVTNMINLCQHDSFIDKVQFIIPYIYNEFDLREFTATLTYVDSANIAHAEILEPQEDLYKEDYIQYFLPVTSQLSKSAGDIEVRLIFTKTDGEKQVNYVLQTLTAIIPIVPIKDFYRVVPDESLDFVSKSVLKIQQAVDELNKTAEIYNETKADNHIVDENTGKVFLTANGVKIGDGLDLASVEVSDGDDDAVDGVISIIGRYDNDEDIETEDTPTPALVNNHTLNKNGQLILTSNGKQVGDAVNVANVSVTDDKDDFSDGIIDLSNRYENVNL